MVKNRNKNKIMIHEDTFVSQEEADEEEVEEADEEDEE